MRASACSPSFRAAGSTSVSPRDPEDPVGAGQARPGGAAGSAIEGQAGDGGTAATDTDAAGASGRAEDTGGSGPSAGGRAPGVGGGAGSGGTASAACPTGALFCDDFDQGPLGAPWDAADATSASRDTSQGYSKPSSLHLVFPAQQTESTALFTKSLTTVGDVLQLSFYLRINHAAEIYPFGLFYPTNGYRLSLHLNGAMGSLTVAEQTAGRFGDGKNYGEHPTTATLSADNEWRHVEVSIRAGAGTVRVRVDEATVLEETALLGAEFVHDGKCTLGLGIYYAPAQTSWDAHFDSVVATSP